MIKANVLIDSKNWKKKIANPKKYLNLKFKLLKKLSFFNKKKQEFSILLTNNNKMKKLNKKFRKKNKATDVLSFPQKGLFKNQNYIGDLAISFEIINKRSKKTNFFNEFDKIWVHGYLHLIGYDHKNNKEYKKMHNKEKLILNNIRSKIDKKN